VEKAAQKEASAVQTEGSFLAGKPRKETASEGPTVHGAGTGTVRRTLAKDV
jgi:hypothetical protein